MQVQPTLPTHNHSPNFTFAGLSALKDIKVIWNQNYLIKKRPYLWFRQVKRWSENSSIRSWELHHTEKCYNNETEAFQRQEKERSSEEIKANKVQQLEQTRFS